ncbi:MAG: hypothetical protein RL076_1675 [Chloroflexota bacterium]|jgi:uncharacterized protein (DUF58 family)
MTHTRMVSPWYRPLLLVLLGIFLLIAAQGTGVLFFARIGYLIIGVVCGAALWAFLGVAGLTITRTLQTPRVMTGEYVREQILVANQFPWQRGIVEILDDTTFMRHMTGFVVTLAAHQQRQRTWRTIAQIRGTYVMGPTYIVGSDPFGLFRIERRFTSMQQLIVVPAPQAMPLPTIGKDVISGRPQVVRQIAAHAPTIMSIREYRPGDAVSRIHWRSSAKRGNLMLKEGNHEPGAHIWLVYDAQRQSHAWVDHTSIPMPMPSDDSTEEYAIHVLANLADAWLRAGHAVGLCMHGSERVVLAPQRTISHRIAIFDALAAMRAVGDVALDDVLVHLDAYNSAHTSVCVVTSRGDARWVPVLQEVSGRGGDVSAVLIDAASFAAPHDCLASEQALVEANIPHTVVVRGMALSGVVWR